MSEFSIQSVVSTLPQGQFVKVEVESGVTDFSHFLVKYENDAVTLLELIDGEVAETVAIHIKEKAFKYDEFTATKSLSTMTVLDLYFSLIQNDRVGEDFIYSLLYNIGGNTEVADHPYLNELMDMAFFMDIAEDLKDAGLF